MVGRFEFTTAARIVFGPGKIQSLASLAQPLGKRALVVSGANPARAAKALADIPANYFSVPSEPTLALVREGVKAARACDYLIGFGGGSAMDAAKWVTYRFVHTIVLRYEPHFQSNRGIPGPSFSP